MSALVAAPGPFVLEVGDKLVLDISTVLSSENRRYN